MATNLRPHLRRLGVTLALTTLVATAVSKERHQYYRVVDLGALGAVSSVANAINDNNIAVGNVQYQDGHVQAFYWSLRTGIQRLDSSAKQSRAFAINDRNIIGGSLTDRNKLTTAVLWNLAGESQLLAEAPFGAFATALNNRGDAVGFRQDGIFMVTDNAFSWPPKDPTFAWDDLFDSDSESFAQGINDRGQITGYVDRQAFLLEANGKLKILAGDSNSGAPAMGTAINSKGDITISQSGSAFLYEHGSRRTISGPGPTYPLALNDSDQVVGYVVTGGRSGFIWDKSHGVMLLDDLLVTPGWQIFSANGINRNGWIAGLGVHKGRQHAVVLIPANGPAPAATP